MYERATYIVLAVLAAGLLFWAVTATPAKCAWCYSAPCFGENQCNAGCVCMSSGPGGGKCVSLE